MKRLVDWVDARTDLRRAINVALFEPIPGGARWRHAWGSLLVFVFFLQVVTGFVLWTAYSPSTITAWESSYYLQKELGGGWLIRGLHHFSAQAFMVVLGLHIAQMIVFRAYRAPGEIGFWAALLLLPVGMALSVTGWMLPYDQNGFWAARVPLNLLAITPGVGASLRELALGGADASHLTLTRFLALHAGLLPATVLVLLVLHRRSRWRQIRRVSTGEIGRASYWPDQVLRNALLWVVLVVGLVGLVWTLGGAPLGAPADPSATYSAARPEWFFLFLYQFLKLFPGGTEVWGAVVIPGLVLTWLILAPFIGKTRGGQRANVIVLGLLAVGMLILTIFAWREDARDTQFQMAKAAAKAQSERILTLVDAAGGIPPAGALSLLQADPLTQGPRLFAQNCSGCHRYQGLNGLGQPVEEGASAPDLYQFAGRAWLTGLLTPSEVDSPHYFGGTAFAKGKMVRFVKRDVAEFNEEQAEQLRRVILAVSAEADLPWQKEIDAQDEAMIIAGRELIADETMQCVDCHKFHEHDYEPSAPDFTGYGSREWLTAFIQDPAHERFYGKRNDRMPQFGLEQWITPEAMGLIVDWLRGDYVPQPDRD